jgi:hypothetical protein
MLLQMPERNVKCYRIRMSDDSIATNKTKNRIRRAVLAMSNANECALETVKASVWFPLSKGLNCLILRAH